MLHVISSNRLEQLLEAMMVSMIGADGRAADPFTPDTIVVQNAGMSRWVSQQIALLQGISAHTRFETPGTFLWSVARCWIDQLPAAPPAKDVLTWQIFEALSKLLPTDEFAELRAYLANDQSGLLRLQLAQNIGSAFDRYLIYRPQLINSWQRGADRHWQAVLWRHICADIQGHWGTIEDNLARIASQKLPSLPVAKISVFGISDMPPLYTRVFAALANHVTIDLYYLNPCEHYWADIVDEQQQSRRRARARKAGLDDPTGLLDIGNPLLASWGHAGQAFLDQLLELGVHESEIFVQPQSVTLLRQVQIHVLELQNNSGELASVSDQSIQIHSAHSVLREVQILHDQLLRLFERHPDLKPRDIIVMAPDIDRYAPFVDATFALAQASDYIPWSISDRRLRAEQQALEVLNWLINLPLSRFDSTEILALFDLPSVRSRFAVDTRAVQMMHQWVRDSGIRWSYDRSMRESLELPASDMNSWQFGLRRLFLGFALPDMNGELYGDIAPYPHIEGAQSEDLQVLAEIVELCARWRERLQTDYTATQWLAHFDQLISDFFELDDDESQGVLSARNKLYELLETTGSPGTDELMLSREVVAELYHQVLEDSSNERNFLKGRVTFSNMVPMRSIPFRVVCILGMNAEDFPRSDNPQSFDLMAAAPKRGDRRRRNDDRYLFLEALLSARDVFYISYMGRDVRDNSEKAASTVVTELIDYANLQLIEHPLQPFSQKYFDNSKSQLFSYKKHWYDAANIQQALEIPRFIDSGYHSDKNPPREVELPEMIAYFVSPAEVWLRQRLEVRAVWQEDDLETTEPFSINGLSRWKLKQQAYEWVNKGDSKKQIQKKLMAHGEVPEGPVGKLEIDAIYTDSVELDRRVLSYKTKGSQAQDFDLNIDGTNLYGRLGDIRREGLFNWRFGKLRCKDLLSAWISHLVLCEISKTENSQSSVFVCEDWTVKFKKTTHSSRLLSELLSIRNRGLLRPIPWFPNAAYAKFLSNLDITGSYPASKWKGAYSGVAADELRGFAADTIWRGQPNPFTEEFESLTSQVMAPLFEHASFIKAEQDVL